jgi:hypothetical protein
VPAASKSKKARGTRGKRATPFEGEGLEKGAEASADIYIQIFM